MINLINTQYTNTCVAKKITKSANDVQMTVNLAMTQTMIVIMETAAATAKKIARAVVIRSFQKHQ